MNKKNEATKNRLGLNLFEANLKRHPSVKCLFDEDGNMKSPSDSNDQFLLLNIDNKSEKESNDTSNNNAEDENDEKEKTKETGKDDEIENKENNKKIKTMSVQINRVGEKIVDNKETFYVEMSDEEIKERSKYVKKKTDKKSKFLGKPLSYGFNDTQKKFDKDITDSISKGKEYSEIEEKFMGQLKKK